MPLNFSSAVFSSSLHEPRNNIKANTTHVNAFIIQFELSKCKSGKTNNKYEYHSVQCLLLFSILPIPQFYLFSRQELVQCFYIIFGEYIGKRGHSIF